MFLRFYFISLIIVSVHLGVDAYLSLANCYVYVMFAIQPRPLAAIDLIHKQPVRWTSNRTVTCDGGGGPLGHPRIYINVDKPQICWCTYCGLPFVSFFA